MKRWQLLPVLPLLCLSPFAQAESTSDRVLQLQQQMAVMQGELSSLVAVQQADKGSQSALASLLQRTQRLEQEVRNLRGEVDTKTHDLQTEQQATASKVQALAAQLAVATPATGITASTSSVLTSTPAAAVASAASNTSAPSIQGLGQADYQHAFNFLRDGKYGDAVTGLQGFIQKYPQSSLVPDAYYWLGQAQYVLGQNDAALKSLYVVPTRFSQSSKAPEAMLRMAEIYQAIGKKNQATVVLNKILKQYPSTPSAQKAEAQLQALPSQ
ncbi:tol-pal system protein YbgF [Acidithiobacillus sp. HP-6]|uniref:tol-pal system protein YbgF n=1 Tax=unclassified Acidithiobacillus TaxID=2614800 RepID=UPI001879ADB7|nr:MULTISPECIES: tol-pal system protein YbgF [unclassified Acidithiobacillus]MBE7563160.1 tol-pal system protein YbgF [Acidithiobacillus sp. HP-6]MBE7570216.1 tol-pal system protein YbgF [Acidithiobacillus sp. HP-2]MDD2750586.1 tol-pal system protein YbgF [Acidithiobacillus sp.]MDD5279618.1 tol-pal system protein YbgF [Acidithiobacillus sp.]